MGETARLLVTGFGPSATASLARLIDDAKSGDPLAPVDVIVPSGVAGVTVRRAIAGRGLVNVRFSSLPQLAERLAARHMALAGVTPLTPTARWLGVRRAIDTATGLLADAGRHPNTAALVDAVFTELDDAEPSEDGITALERSGARGAEVADLYRRYRDVVRAHATYPRVLDLAVDGVDNGEAPDTQVILFAPRRMTAAERRLLAALARANRLRAVFCLVADDETELRDWLTDQIGPPYEVGSGEAPDTQLELTPDAEEEVRIAIRRVLAFFAKHPVRPERVAISYRSPVPYARLLDEQLTAAGLPFHVTSQRKLTDSVAGHALLQLLDLRPHDYARAEVLDWLTDAPILNRDGTSVPTARWERLSREAGVSRTHRIWQERLELHANSIAQRRADVTDDDEHADERRERADVQITDCQMLAGFVAEIVATCDDVAAAGTWAEVRDALHQAVTRFLGTAEQVARWGGGVGDPRWVEVEKGAYDGVLAAIEALAGLGGVNGATPTYELVRQALASELDRTLPGGTTLGRGLTVANVRDLAGADFDLLVVLGMSEGAFPPRLREHPILGDTEREAVGAGLQTLADRRRAERRDYLAAVAGARTVVLSSPRADTRAQRALHPSPWFMEVVTRLNDGEPVGSAELSTLHVQWLSRHDSFEAALRATSTPASESEYDVVLALHGHGDLLAATDRRYARGREAVDARRDGAFGEWTGHVGPLSEPLLGIVNGRLSASSLQTWATCGLRFGLATVLGVHDLDDPDEDTIDAAVRGSLVHDVLERFFRETLATDDGPGRDPDQAWSAPEIARARELLDQAAGELEATGRTGRPLLWQAQTARLHRQLTRILTVDSALRAARRARPIALEDAFGRDGRPPLTLHLPRSGEVPLAGYIDRVDRTDEGGLVVTDYKTGKGSGYDRIPQVGGKALDDSDLVDRGRKLQLVMYALAAREQHGTPETPVESYYWFVEQGSLHRGAPIGTDAERRLLDVLDVTVSGIRDGVYPAHPGEETFFGWESCGFCAYDRICPTARGEQWERIRRAPAVRPFAELAAPSDMEDDQ